MRAFFDATEQAKTRITSVFDLISPISIALWNLRWQVAGYLNVAPHATVPQLAARFVDGSGSNWRNLRRACIETSWDEQQEELASVLLTSTTAVFEGWCEDMSELLPNTVKEPKLMQFPSGKGKNNHPTGIGVVLARAAATPSAPLIAAYGPVLQRNVRYSKALLDNWLICFRYFKEARNALAHHGGSATQLAVTASAELARILDPKVEGTPQPDALGLSVLPEHGPFVLGGRVRLRMHGVIGLTDIMLRIMTTIDAELSQCIEAESALARRWKVRYRLTKNLRSQPDERSRQVASWIRKLGLPPPTSPLAVVPVLQKLRIAY